MSGLKMASHMMAILLVCSLSACSSTRLNDVRSVISAAFTGGSVDGSRLKPDHTYLQIDSNGQRSFVVLASVDDHPDGPVEVYFGGQRQVLRLQNGRVVGAVGYTSEWRNVSLKNVPSWTAVKNAPQPLTLQRVRDVMPGYRYGIHDQVTLRSIATPQKGTLLRVAPAGLSWFQEDNQAMSNVPSNGLMTPARVEAPLPPARYAVAFASSTATVIYAEQCLAPDLCFSWQRWTPDKRSR